MGAGEDVMHLVDHDDLYVGVSQQVQCRSFDIDDARAWIVRRLKGIKNLPVKAPLARPYCHLQG
jgi:hypothetical protein